MDWLTFKFCVLIWILCVSKSQSQLLNSTSISNQLQVACQEGQPVSPPDECNSCMCFSQRVHCTNHTCPEKECINGEEIPPTDACNTCICRRGKVTCTNMICIPAPDCVEKQLYPSQNDCNACICVNGFIKCTSNGCSEENLPAVVTTTPTITPKKTKRCTEGSPLPAPIECLECFCENGRKRCKYICNQTVQMETRFADTSEPACFPGQTIPSPDDCNHCICFEGEIHCTNRPCQTYMRIGRQCGDEQMVIQFDECNECYCIEGQLECSNLVCIRGSKCVQGQEIPKPDSCNACVCVDGHIVCTNSECPLASPRNALPGRTATELKPLNDECHDGDVLPTLPPPYDCNKCFCIDNIIMCTMNSCVESKPEINGRLKEQNEQTDLKNFDKQISVEPFIDVLYKDKDKLPSKVIHTHAYNGYHQEIKVQAKHLPKDATNLFKALASSLDNSALASISQKLLTSSDSMSRNPDSKIPFDHQEVQNNLLGEGNILTTQSNKIITSGSQSNETILVIPNIESESVLPLRKKHEIIWKSVSAPAPIVYHNNQPIVTRNSKEENLNFYSEDKPPSFLTSIPQNDIIREPTKFSRPGLQPALPINIKDGKINYGPYYPDNNQFKPVPSGFVGKGDELPQRPLYQPTKPAFIAPNINGVQPKPSQSLYVPNVPKYYPNQVKPQQFQFKPNQNQPNQILLPASINKGIQLQPLFPNTPNQPIVATNQYNPPQFGLKPGQESPLNNIGNQTYQQFNKFPPNFPMNPPVLTLPLQNKRISSIESEGSKEITTHSTLPSTIILNPQQNRVSPEYTQHNKPTHSQFVPNPSIYYKNEFEAPKINEVNPEVEHLIQNSTYSQPHTSSKLNEANIPKVHNKKRKYNTTHSHYEKHSTVIYVSENDPHNPDHPKIVGHDPNQNHDVPHTNEYEQNVPNQDLTILQLDEKEPYPKLTDYNPSQTSSDPGMINPNSRNVTTYQFDKYPHSPSDGKNTDQIKSNQNRTNPTIPVYPNILGNYPQTSTQFIKEGLNDPGFADGSRSPANSVKDPTHQKPPPQIASIQNQNQPEVQNLPPSNLETPDNNYLSGMLDERGSADGFQYPSHSAEDPSHSKQNIQKPTNSLYGPTQNQYLPGMLDERGFADGFQYPSNSAENPSHPKQNIQKPTNSLYGPTQNQHLPGMLDERGSADGFQYPSHSAEDPSHSKQNIQKPTNSLYGPTQNQHLPVMLDERGSADGFQYPSNSAENPSHPKQNIQKPTNSLYGPTQNQHLPGMLDERGSADGFQYPSHSAEDPSHSKQNIQKPTNSLYGPTQNQHLPGMLDERGSADGFQYPSNSAENPSHPKQNIQKPTNSLYGPTQNQHLPGMLDERGSADGFQYPSNSAENPSHPKQNMQKPTNSFYDPTQNQHIPGMFDERGTAGGFQYPYQSAKYPSNPIQKPTNSLYSPTQNQINKSSHFVPYKSNFDPAHPKDNLHIPPHPQFGTTQNQFNPYQYGHNANQNPTHQKLELPNNPFDPTLNQHKPGTSKEFQNPPNSAENPIHTRGSVHTPPQPALAPSQIPHLLGTFKEPGSNGSFHNPSNSAENPSHSIDKLNKPFQTQFGPTQHQPILEANQPLPSFHYPSHSTGNPSNLKQKQPYSLNGPSQNQNLPGMFNGRGSADGFQNPSHSAEDPSHPKQNIQKPTNSLYGPTQNQHLPGMLDERGSADGFQYPSYSAEDPSHPKQNKQKPTNSLYGPTQNQHLPGMLDERGSADGFQYPSNSAENPSHPKQNIQKPSNALYGPTQNQHVPGMFDERGSAGGFQYPSHSAEDPSHPKQNIQKPSNSLYGPTYNQHLPGMFEGHGSAGGFQYPSNSAENPLQTKDNRPHPSQSQFLPSNNHYKENVYKQPNSQFGPTQNKNSPDMFDERGSANGFQYPSHSAENPLQTKDNYQQHPQNQFLPSNKQYKENIYKQPSPPFVPTQNQHSAEDPTKTDKLPNSQLGPSQDKHLPGIFDERGSADGFQYTSNSAEDPGHQKNNPDTTPELKQSQNQPEHLSLEDSNIPNPYNDKAANQPDKFSNLHPKNNNYNNSNPLRPWINLDHDQYKPSSFDNLLNGIHNIPWSDPDAHKEVSNIVTSTPQTRFEPDRDQYKPLSLDNPLNGVHEIPFPILNQDTDALGTDAVITTPHADFKPKQDQYGPSMIKKPSLPLSNQHDISDEDGNELPTEQDILDAFLELQNPRPEIKPDSDSDNDHPNNDGTTSNLYDQLYPLFKAVKKLSEPDDSEFSVEQLDLLPYLLPGIANILNNEPVEDHDDALPVEDSALKRLYPLSKLKSKLKQLPESGNRIINWLQTKLNKLFPTKYNVTVNKNDINMTKIFHLIKNFTRPSVKDNVKLQNIPSFGYDPEIIKNIMDVFQEDILTTTPSDLTDAYDNRFKSDPTVSEESRQQEKQTKYPDVHIILHQPFEEDYMDIPPYTQTDGAANLATDMDVEGLESPLFSKMFNPRFRHRPKDQKDECGDGTHWISKCHDCSCYFGQPKCFKMNDCELRSFGEPMACKPYSHFNMGCYTCECNGDGVAECDSTDCTTKPSGKSKVSETTEPPLPIFNEFYDSKNTNEILQYYNFYKKLPKDCPKQDLQAQYPTCERGTSWVSSCQKCECNESGKHKCVKIDDCELDFDSYGKPGRCKPNTKFYPKTNSLPCVECTCNDEGNPYCPTADYKKH